MLVTRARSLSLVCLFASIRGFQTAGRRAIAPVRMPDRTRVTEKVHAGLIALLGLARATICTILVRGLSSCNYLYYLYYLTITKM